MGPSSRWLLEVSFDISAVVPDGALAYNMTRVRLSMYVSYKDLGHFSKVELLSLAKRLSCAWSLLPKKISLRSSYIL